MTIRFKCTHCKKPLSVKDQLAGKRAACPVCKKPIVIPAPVADPADVEALAAAALSDDPAEAAAAAKTPAKPTTIVLPCPYCDETITFSAELAGKKAPCPHCKHIVKVPLLEEEKPKDWREPVKPRGPSGAKRDAPEKLEGAWDSTRGTVGQETLEEVGAIQEEREPVSVGQWIKRGLLAAGVLVVIVAAWLTFSALRTRNQAKDAIDAALEAVNGSKLSPPATAAVHRSAGEYFAGLDQPSEAQDHFSKALGQFSPKEGEKVQPSFERDALLIALALAIIELGGDDQKVIDKTRVDWEVVEKELGRVIGSIGTAEARITALRELGTALKGRGQFSRAVGLAAPYTAAAEAEDGKPRGELPVEASQAIAFYMAAKKDKDADQIIKMPIDPKAPHERVARIGYAEGKARQGSFAEARERANAPGESRHRAEALVGVAAVALLGGNRDEARGCVEDALKIESDMRKNKLILMPWLAYQFVKVAADAGMADQVEEVAESIKEPGCKALAQLALVKSQLGGSNSKAELSLADKVKNKDSLSYFLALEAIARHNAKLGYRSDLLSVLDSLEERHRPAIHTGIALGLRDR